ncbi:PaaX family transcriptional regulator C-terminal domain-containing protein [Micromonospora sp. WMMD736]|uniref:PaaX family transcriptional regulator C-terminal domain-containing protein n=1 Tax=Micromonospora sp. WMMD736 TaxID=3404112 RepID=UPI003B9303AC
MANKSSAPGRMTARSVILSLLLGAHPAHATASELIRLTADFSIKESTVRVALTRMVSGGDLVRSEGGYRLSDRLLARQRRQDDAINPRLHDWGGDWTTLVITSLGVQARTRTNVRNTLQYNRFAELREGIWLRPDNLDLELPTEVTRLGRVLSARDADPGALAAQLWDLPGWAREGRRLLSQIGSATDIPGWFTAAAGIVRHLLTDPVLPAQLLPEHWPGAELRTAYQSFAAELVAHRDDVELMEAVT